MSEHQIVASKADAGPGAPFDSDRISGARFTADGKTLLIALDERLEFYDVDSGHELERFRFEDRLLRFSVSPNGKLLATVEQQDGNVDRASRLQGSGRRTWLRFRDLYSKEVNREIELPEFSYVLEFSPNGRLLATGLYRATPSGQTRWISVWETLTGREYARVKGYSSQPMALAFSTDTKWLASSHYATTAVLVWDLDQFRVGK
jgi:WD40 repeat protein